MYRGPELRGISTNEVIRKRNSLYYYAMSKCTDLQRAKDEVGNRGNFFLRNNLSGLSNEFVEYPAMEIRH